MSDDPVAEGWVFTNHAVHCQRLWNGRFVPVTMCFAGMVFVALPVILVLLGWLGRDTSKADWELVANSVFIGVLLVLVGLWDWRVAHWRSWSIDSEGIEARDLDGQLTCLRWRQIERVHWGLREARFLGPSRRIDLIWSGLPAEQIGPVKQRIASLLPEFALSVNETKAHLVFVLVASLPIAFGYVSYRLMLLVGNHLLLPIARQGHWDKWLLFWSMLAVFLVLFGVMNIMLAIVVTNRLWHEPRRSPLRDEHDTKPLLTHP